MSDILKARIVIENIFANARRSIERIPDKYESIIYGFEDLLTLYAEEYAKAALLVELKEIEALLLNLEKVIVDIGCCTYEK